MKYLNYEGLLEFKNQLDSSLDNKVDKITGKGLSTNDFTTDLKNKLDNIEAGATANEGTVTGITIGQTDYIPIDGQITLPDYPTTFGASGINHSSGLVPDPGATQGNTKFLREDGTWAEPESGGNGSIDYIEVLDNLDDLDATLISTALRKTAQILTAAEQALVKLNLGITEYSASLTRNIIISTSEPTSSDGNDGDIWLVYES